MNRHYRVSYYVSPLARPLQPSLAYSDAIQWATNIALATTSVIASHAIGNDIAAAVDRRNRHNLIFFVWFHLIYKVRGFRITQAKSVGEGGEDGTGKYGGAGVGEIISKFHCDAFWTIEN